MAGTALLDAIPAGVERCMGVVTLAFQGFDVAFDVGAYLGEICFHAGGVFIVDDGEEVFELLANLIDLVVGVGIEEHFLQQVVVFVEYALGNAQMALEGGTWRILMLHDGREDEGAHKRNGE